jgi:Fur family ferric uptake transcriptional regulator
MNSSKFHRNTKQRRVILQELQKLTTHPTAADLYAIVRAQLPRISLGTVYRNLESMSQMGVICKLETSGKEARFDANPAKHYHLRCIRCGRIADLYDSPAVSVREDCCELNGWEILDHHLEFAGICPECRKLPGDK